MSRSLGEVTFQLLKTPQGAGCDRELLVSLINDRYIQLMAAYGWSRLDISGYITTVDVYETGTIAITEGGQTLTGTSTVWTLAMQDRRIRIANRNEYAVFSFVSSTSGTIDAPYEGDTETAATYKIYQNVFELPSGFGWVESIVVPYSELPLEQISVEELNGLDPNREQMGRSVYFAPYEDSSGQVARVELWPIPDTAESYPVRGKRRAERLVETDEQFPGWVNVEAITAGVKADLAELKGDVALASYNEARYQQLLSLMIGEEVDRKSAAKLQLSERFTAHRAERAMGSSRDRRNAILRRMP